MVKGNNEYLKFSKSQCGNKMTQMESRQVQIDMLDNLVEFCDKHGLRYFLSGGTLLGAIRHKGFIPWDDDIDINMPRPDCERLFNLTKGRIGKYVLTMPDDDGFARCCESFRLYNFDTVIESFVGGVARKHPVYHPIYIDIFPIEGLPQNNLILKLHYFKLLVCRKMLRVSALKHMEGSNILAHIFHLVTFVPAKIVGYRNWAHMLQKIAQKYHFDEEDYIGVMTAPVHTVEERVKKKDYLDIVSVEFEGKMYHAPGNYDTYLSQLYGDYMKMPPLEKQKSHHEFNMYWRKKL
ncbi:MAG: LicD family protein [Lachnospiraceae bacterium]|nr:LicD family protein [Lachnospiraceae bacterium]